MLGASSLSQLTEMHEVRYTPTSAYCILEIEGFRIFVSPALFDDSHSEMQALGAEALRALQWQLYLVTRAVGDEPLAKLRLVPIWLELPSKASPVGGAEYHWSREWLKENGRNPDKARSVEITDVRGLLQSQSYLPTMLLHELAHGYHDHVLGEHDSRIELAYERCVGEEGRGGKYDEVLNASGAKIRHYGATNKFEFFACATAAYFVVNDFYPFVRAEMAEYDPECHELMRNIWGTRREGLDFERGEAREARATRTTLSVLQGPLLRRRGARSSLQFGHTACNPCTSGRYDGKSDCPGYRHAA